MSSSFSLPSRASPLFSLLSDRLGVMHTVFSKVLLGSTVSLKHNKTQINKLTCHSRHVCFVCFWRLLDVRDLLGEDGLGVFVC